MSHIARNPVFGVSNPVRHKLCCTATEDAYISHRLQRLLVGRSIILYSQRTIKVLIKLNGMICTFIVGISQKRESVILILILFGTYDMYIMVYKSSNYKQWPGIVFWYSQIQNPVQTKIKTLQYFNYIIYRSFFFLQLQLIFKRPVLLILLVSSGRPFQVRIALGRKELYYSWEWHCTVWRVLGLRKL